jgi:hypothetical protein
LALIENKLKFTEQTGKLDVEKVTIDFQRVKKELNA